MINVNVRKQGGAAVITLPPALLKQLGISVGSQLSLDIDKGAIVVRPAKTKRKKRYSLVELLKGVTPAKMKKLIEDTKWARDGDPVGRELS